MAELESEDSSDGTLVIDEPNSDNQTIEISDDSDSDVEIVELEDDTEENSDVEIVELDDDIEDTTALLNSSRSSSKIGLTCKACSRIFTTNNDLLNHIRKFIGRIGGCNNLTNVTFTAKRKYSENPNSEYLVKKKRGRPPKKNNNILPPVPTQPAPAPITVPLRHRPSIPELIPIIFKSATKPTPTVATNDNILPSLRQILIDEIEPEYPCTICGEIFRHNIGLICHLNTEHKNESTKDTNKDKKSSNKLVKKQNIKRNLVNDKQIEDHESISDTVDLTLLPEFKKNSLMNRMKSYIHTTIKGQVICLLCNIDFKTTKKALSHIEDKHIMDKIGCGYCNLKFVYELKLRSHMAKRHKVICVYKCDKCLKMIKEEEFDSHSEKCKVKVNPIIIKTEEDNI